MFDIIYHKDLDHVFFEIWKRVAKDKVRFVPCTGKTTLCSLYFSFGVSFIIYDD
jgi:hypothetical protein